MHIVRLLVTSSLLTILAWGQNYPYVINTLAGVNPLGDGGPASSALLEYPNALAVDAGGNLYISDSINGRIRLIAPNGSISSFLTKAVVDMKTDAAGNIYAVDGGYQAAKISKTGQVTVIAGAGLGYAGDTGLAVEARIGPLYGIA